MIQQATDTKVITILLIDDNPTFRACLARVFESEPGYRLAAVAASGEEALRLPRTLAPDVVLLDLYLPDGFGLALIGFLKARWPGCRVVVLSLEDAVLCIEAALAAGADDYIPKRYTTERLLPAIQRAVHG